MNDAFRVGSGKREKNLIFGFPKQFRVGDPYDKDYRICIWVPLFWETIISPAPDCDRTKRKGHAILITCHWWFAGFVDGSS